MLSRARTLSTTLFLAALLGCELTAPGVPCKVSSNCLDAWTCAADGFCRPPLMFLVAGDAGPSPDVDSGPSEGGLQRIRVAIDTAGLTQGLADFPLLVRPPQVVPDDVDVHFHDAQGAPLPFEVESWGPGVARALWVLVPSLVPGDDDAHVWLCFGGEGPPTGDDPEEVWRNGYVGVWHLADDPTASGAVARDSTASGMDGAFSGTFTAANVVDAMAGRGLSFTGGAGGEGIEVASNATLSSAALRASFTVEAWVSTRGDVDKSHSFFGKMGGANDRGWDLNIEVYPAFGGWERGLTFRTSSDGASTVYNGYELLEPDRWYYVAGTFTSQGARRLYVDGAAVGQESSPPQASVFDNDAPLTIGKKGNDTDHLIGMLDEVRLSSATRTPGWIAATHLALRGEWLDYGEPEDAP